MYDFEWHKSHGDKTSSSADVVVDLLVKAFPIRSVLDIGCGDGRWLSAFKARTASVHGVDGPWTDKDRILIDLSEFSVHNLESPLDLHRKFDLAMSLEVAEHVAGAFADQFVDNVTSHADLVLFGAAIPYQGGFRHINEQWPSYWSAKFSARGFRCFDLVRSSIWDRDDVYFWYKQNCLVYVRESRADLIDRAERFIVDHHVTQLPLDLAHPELYTSLASYRQIAFKPLLKELPVKAAQKAISMIAGKT